MHCGHVILGAWNQLVGILGGVPEAGMHFLGQLDLAGEHRELVIGALTGNHALVNNLVIRQLSIVVDVLKNLDFR